jgi:hypothetical protein
MASSRKEQKRTKRKKSNEGCLPSAAQKEMQTPTKRRKTHRSGVVMVTDNNAPQPRRSPRKQQPPQSSVKTATTEDNTLSHKKPMLKDNTTTVDKEQERLKRETVSFSHSSPQIHTTDQNPNKIHYNEQDRPIVLRSTEDKQNNSNEVSTAAATTTKALPHNPFSSDWNICKALSMPSHCHEVTDAPITTFG